ncbi:ABC transporter substrate-binding protein [Peristeroidobacter soli]|uniref:ABC transporter substrate-binding protein n=1 Tax=Peristeroidobacter soli TaxID=2497877 RepID=UPI00101C768F|nr:ABC transporter substrate-binding protein [Peristeroidobacter soli]
MQNDESKVGGRSVVRAVAGLFLTAWLGSAQAAETQVVFATPTNAGINLANLTAAMELGYFEKEGIKVKIQEFQGSAIVMSQVAVKSILIGGGGGEPLIVANQPGKSPLPLKFFYNSLRDNIWQFVVPASSKVNTIADLKGKKIGVSSLANAHVPISRLILKQNGIGPNDAQLIAIGAGGAAFQALIDGRVDAYNTYNGNIALYEANGTTPLKRLALPPQLAALFSLGYFAHEDTLKKQPQVLAGFGRGAAKGTLVCKHAAEWCVKTFWKYYPNLKPRDDSAKELARQVHVLEANMKSYLAFPPGQPQRLGEFPPDAWKSLVNILYAGGVLKDASVDPRTFFTNDLVGQINNFDAAAIESMAAGLK